MERIKCIIIDDEPLAISLIESYVAKTPILELVYTSENPISGLAYLQNNEVQLVFLDIQMPQLSGINFMKIAGDQLKYVLTTAYSEYALEGYEHSVVDYLLKPISFDRFSKSISKTKEFFQIKNSAEAYFFVKSSGQQIRINFNEIAYVESIKDYVSINTEREEYIVLETLKSLEQQLPKNFNRIHKSFIINLDMVKAIDGKLITLSSGKPIPIGDTYKSDFLLKIKNHSIS